MVLTTRFFEPVEIPSQTYKSVSPNTLSTISCYMMVKQQEEVSQVSDFAAEIFTDQSKEVQEITLRVQDITSRISTVQQVQPQVHNIAKTNNVQQEYSTIYPKQWRRQEKLTDRLFTLKNRPIPLEKVRRLAYLPPNVDQLNDQLNCRCSQQYSNPNIFFEEWLAEKQKEFEVVKVKKKKKGTDDTKGQNSKRKKKDIDIDGTINAQKNIDSPTASMKSTRITSGIDSQTLQQPINYIQSNPTVLSSSSIPPPPPPPTPPTPPPPPPSPPPSDGGGGVAPQMLQISKDLSTNYIHSNQINKSISTYGIPSQKEDYNTSVDIPTTNTYSQERYEYTGSAEGSYYQQGTYNTNLDYQGIENQNTTYSEYDFQGYDVHNNGYRNDDTMQQYQYDQNSMLNVNEPYQGYQQTPIGGSNGGQFGYTPQQMRQQYPDIQGKYDQQLPSGNYSGSIELPEDVIGIGKDKQLYKDRPENLVRTNQLSSIASGGAKLNKVDPEAVKKPANPMNNLLQAIQGGAKLRKVDVKEDKKDELPATLGGLGAVAEILARRKAIESSSESDDYDDDWD